MDTLFEILEETNQITSRSRMESGLLNAFHDDHFDGNYSKFDNNLDLWSDGNDAMGLQLTETLHGILPINATEEEPHFFETDIEHRNSFRFHTETDLSETVYDMDPEEGDFILTNYPAVDTMSESMSPSIEIISVDPNCEFSSPVTIDDDSDIESDRSSSRNSNYNSNSDSSSIGDYESHSSEDDDDETENNSKFQNITIKQEKADNEAYRKTATKSQQQPQQHLPKNSQQSKLHCTSFDGIGFSIDDIDLLDNRKSMNFKQNGRIKKSLESEIDVKNFDLATFITQDDFDFIEPPQRNNRIIANPVTTHANEISINDIKIEENDDVDRLSKADSDTEAIIDIETVHDMDDDKPMLLRKQAIEYYPVVDLNESFVQIDDDTKRDPSWSPNNGKAAMKLPKTKTMRQTKTKKSSNLLTQCNRMLNNNHTATLNNSVTKPNAVLHRKKFGIGKGKNISMCTKPDLYDSLSDPDSCDGTTTIATAENNCKINGTNENGAIASNNNNSISNNSINISNNKAIVNRKEADTAVIIPKIIVKIEKPIEVKVEREVDLHNDDASSIVEIIAEQTADNSNSEVSFVVPIKKKLNLEEYKRRRENQLIDDTKIKKTIQLNNIINPVATIKEEDAKNPVESTPPVFSVLPNAPNSQKTVAQSKPNAILNSKSDRGFVDPILEAKNKVLRMQELKKAARSKLIDSTVSSKVGPITPILPLEQICNGNYKSQDQSVAKLNPEYEEIIIVSVSCNTEITLPPVFEKLDRNGAPKNGIRQSTSLLSNINDTIKKANAAKISSNSLLSSIQDVVLKKSTTTLLNGAQLSQKSPNIGVSPPSQFSPQKPEMSQTEQSNPGGSGTTTIATADNQTAKNEHGEDKIIMHLRKDRIRKKTFSIAIQTDELPQFPPITLLLAEKYSHSHPGNTKKRKRHGNRHYRSRRNDSASSDDDDDADSYRSRSHVRYRSVSSQGTNRSLSPRSGSRYSSERTARCYSNSRRTGSPPYRKIRRRSSRSTSHTKSRASSSTATDSETGRRARSRDRRNRRYSTSHSSSSDSSSSSRSRSRSRSPRSKSRSRSRSRFSSNRSHSNNHRQPSPAVEERRIVYVGRIERETSKEDLKRKFSAYGPIKQITLHYKDTGMKYGFVTFERAQDAYATIDRGMADSKINMYDISFGGRRAFCRASYSDLDGAATNSLQILPYPNASRSVPIADDSFEALLQKVKEKMSSTKSATQTSRVKT